MRIPSALAVALAVVGLIVTASVSLAQVPEQMNYQVMLTDDADQPLADQAVQLVFRIYSQVSGGSALWTETQNVTTNSIGVVSVVLGSVTPLTIAFSGPRWLEIQVGAEVMTPRRPLVAAPYALQADNADNLGGTAAASFALSSTLSTAGTINSPGNPVDWTKLKSVPAGFADGTDNTGGGGGGWVDDGTSVRLETATDKVGIGTASPECPLHVENPSTVESSRAICGISTPSTGENLIGIWGESKSTSGTNAAIGVVGAATGATGTGIGVYGATESPDGWAGYFHGAKNYFDGYVGIGKMSPLYPLVVASQDISPVIYAENQATSGLGDAGYFSSCSSSSYTWTLTSWCIGGRAAHFTKTLDDDKYAAYVAGANSSSEGLYVSGTIVSTALTARTVPTSRGTEAIFGLAAPDVEVQMSGTGALSDGVARIEFERLFAESIAGPENLRITATPVGAWSALYVERVDGEGFTLASAGGEKDVVFNWVAIGRAKGYERAPEVVIPDPAEEARVAAEKMAAIGSARPTGGGPVSPIATTMQR